MDTRFQQFFNSPAFAVIGASNDRHKFGNIVLRCYMAQHKLVYPVNPKETIIEGLRCYNSIEQLPDTAKSISVITPPHISELIIDQAYAHGIQNVWLQPGAESPQAITKATKYGINLIADGSCILIILGAKI